MTSPNTDNHTPEVVEAISMALEREGSQCADEDIYKYRRRQANAVLAALPTTDSDLVAERDALAQALAETHNDRAELLEALEHALDIKEALSFLIERLSDGRKSIIAETSIDKVRTALAKHKEKGE